MEVPGRRYDSILALLNYGADYRIVNKWGNDAILLFERQKISFEKELINNPNDEFTKMELRAAQPVFDWLTNAGVDWKAARAALESPETIKNLKNLPADYKHRPWLPQRPTLKKPEVKADESEKDAA